MLLGKPQRFVHALALARAEAYLGWRGYVVLNPAALPVGMEHGKYLPINDAMISVADEVFLIPGWQGSAGCAHEVRTAQGLGKPLHELPPSAAGTGAGAFFAASAASVSFRALRSSSFFTSQIFSWGSYS